MLKLGAPLHKTGKHGTIQYMKPDGEVVYEAVFKEDKLVKTKVDKKSQKKE